MLISAAVNVLVAAGVMSRAYISFGLFIAAAGVFVIQLRRSRRRKPPEQSEGAAAKDEHRGGGLLTAAWLTALLVWVVSLAWAIFIRR